MCKFSLHNRLLDALCVTARYEAVQTISLNSGLTSLNLRFASSFLLAMTQSEKNPVVNN